jgi:formylglycine-generating enzyme required for sulfatase activity
MHIFLNAPKYTSTFFLVFFSLCTVAQKQNGVLEKIGLKNLQSHVSYIPAKSFNSLVYTGKDSVSDYNSRISTVAGFYMSPTEVTNKEYREFVYYVRDSLAHNLLGHFKSGNNSIDWNLQIDWKDDRLDPIMVSPDNRIYGRKEIDPERIFYSLDFFGQQEEINIYPDTLVWIRDFAYAYNEPLAKKYFSTTAYDNYPVVGISLKQAMAFCRWKTGLIDHSLKGKEDAKIEVIVRLPSHTEWESAAFDVKDSVSLFNGNKGYSCNFGTITTAGGTMKKDYKDDGYFYTAPVKSYLPGPFGLYDMKGNVAEWTSTAREEIMNAEIKTEKMKTFFIVKGGGWNSPPFYLQAGVCQFFPVDAAHSFVGFRYVVEVRKK